MDLKVNVLIWQLLLYIFVFTKFVLFQTSAGGKLLNCESFGCGFSDIYFISHQMQIIQNYIRKAFVLMF